jgi:hypothetical protein
MSASNFHAVPKVPDSVAHLDPDLVVEVLSRHGVNVSDAAGEMSVASADLRRLLCAKPHLTDMAVELEERRLDLAEKNIYEALCSDDSRRRDAASFFVIRNSHRARKRGWITTSTSVAELARRPRIRFMFDSLVAAAVAQSDADHRLLLVAQPLALSRLRVALIIFGGSPTKGERSRRRVCGDA